MSTGRVCLFAALLAAGCSDGGKPGFSPMTGDSSLRSTLPSEAFVHQALRRPDTLTDPELKAQLQPGHALAAQLAALRVLHRRQQGVEETAALLSAPDTDPLVRLNALAGLTQMHTPEARSALHAHYRRSTGGAERRQIVDLLTQYGDQADQDLLTQLKAGEAR